MGNEIITAPAKANRFRDVDNIGTLLRQLTGAGSICWEHPERAGTFNSELAVELSNEASERLDQLLNEPIGDAEISAIDDGSSTDA